jgi:drug/metabolite transporter (DMT)-like permease
MTTHEMEDALPGAAPWVAFAACAAIWGSTFLVISVGNDALAPVWAATLRLALAALLLVALTRARGRRLPRGAALRSALGYGFWQFGVNFPLLYWGEHLIPSGLAAVLYATVPLSSALLARAFGLERLTVAKLAGTVVALGGVAVLFSDSLRLHVAPLGVLAVFGGATAAAVGTVVLKRGPRQDPFALNAVGCAAGAVVSGAATFALREPHVLPTTAAAVLPILYLTVAGSLGAFVIMSWLVGHWPVSRSAYVTVVVPVVALTLGVLFRHERLTAASLGGVALIMAGLLVGMRRPRPPAATARS